MEEEGEERTKCEVCISGCKQVTTFTLSHVGLLTLVVCYCMIGAVVFEALEADHEILVKQNVTKIRKAVAHDLWNMTQTLTYIKPENWSNFAKERLKTFENELVKAMRSQGWDGSEDVTKLNWNTLGALFYSIIVITTIGYGHIAPKTMWGRIVTIFYAIIGIPLMVVCWSHIGDFMANSFRLIYWKVCCYICTRNPKPQRSSFRGGRFNSVRSRAPQESLRMKSRSIRRSARTSQRSADSAASGGSLQSAMSDPGVFHMDSMRSPNIRRQFNGSGRAHHYPQSSTLPRITQPKSYPHPSTQYHSHTRSARSEEPSHPTPKNVPVLFNRYAEDVGPQRSVLETTHEHYGDEDEYLEEESRTQIKSHDKRHMAPEELNSEYWDEDEDEYDGSVDYEMVERTEMRPVPIWLCSFLVISYIIGGAYLFHNWEGWGILDSAYFCFITLTTIGFGDFVPASRLTENPEVSIALCSLYLLFGIALLAMSFNLVQEQVINTFKELAIRLGIISEEESER